MSQPAPRTRSNVPMSGVLAAAVLLRLLLFATTALPAILERRPELTSPLTSYRSLKEGVYLYNNDLNPYAGGVFYHSPVYLFLFSYIVPITSLVLTALFWTAVDLIAAVLLTQIWRSRSVSGSPRFAARDSIVPLLFLFNPYTLLSCLARSTTSLDNALVLGAIAGACTGQRVYSMISLALVAHTGLYPVLLLPPLLLVLQNTSKKSTQARVADLFLFGQVYCGVGALNTLAFGKSWANATVGVILTASDLTPNVGMWWYFFTEMFDHFRPFFRGVFQLHLVIYVAPLCLRLSDPVQAVLVLVGGLSTWKSYPTVGDMALWAGLLGCFPELVAGAGNANFFYAATMVYGLNSTLAIADVLGAIIGQDLKQRLLPLIFETNTDCDVEPISVVQLATLD